MIKIIEGKRYNTATATLIAEHEYGHSGDFKHSWNELYVTKKGVFFIAGRGGAMSEWSEKTGQNEWSGGEGIRVIDAKEALERAEQWDADPDVIAKYFDVEDA